MEAVEEVSVQRIGDDVKVNMVTEDLPAGSVEANQCHKTNGVVDSTTQLESADATSSESRMLSSDAEIVTDTDSQSEIGPVISDTSVVEASTMAESAPEEELLAVMETNAAVEHLLGNNNASEEITEEIIESSVGVVCQETEVTIENTTTVEMDNETELLDKVTFETEILVEKNDNESNEAASDKFDNSNILSDLGHSMELSEVLRSADTTENIENNNSTAGEEVFNKEELLDILEGNDVAPPSNEITELLQTGDTKAKQILEAQIAMKQLTRLQKKMKVPKQQRKRYSLETKKGNERTPRRKKGPKSVENNEMETENVKENLEENINTTEETVSTDNKSNNTEANKSDSIVNVLVQDWDDDEPLEMEQSRLLKENENLGKTSDQLVKVEETASSQETEATTTKSDSPNEIQTNCKSGEEGQPHRRLSRVIKKKVIFDPDNPDTFTKVKVITKSKEPQLDKEQPPPKKVKSEQTPQRSKSKSPMSKLQWKKPPPKNGNSKQNKRLTEIDKLLMDEGAVNMIYQLTSEAPKGKKNMKTKAEFIKKLQSSTPDSKEMKFRERKKETRCEEGEAKKILVGKQRSSMSSTVMSPSVDDSFETHSADDSIIYRRHSSSSYSSSCMSPRRLSDVDPGTVQSAARASRQSSNQNQSCNIPADQPADIFMADVGDTSNEVIIKNDCLSIKEKLSKKISMAFNKRKRDTSKTEKPSKQKKVAKEEKDIVKLEPMSSFKYVTVTYDQRLAEICIRKAESTQSVEMLKELELVLQNVDNMKDISVTLLTSENGVLCSDLDLRPLIDENMERRTNYAYEIAESVRSLLSIVDRHSKLVITGVWGACSGVALALVALSDVAVASECATFAVDTPPVPGIAALSASTRQLPQSVVNDLVVFGRRLSAQEAVQSGLVNRTVWPARGGEQVRACGREIAAQPTQSLLLRKQLLSLKKTSSSDSVFQVSLEKERDLLVEYWTSVEGQEILRANLSAA